MWWTSRLILRLLIAVAVVAPLSAVPLNPTVEVLPKPTGPVPADCYEGLAAPLPRVEVAEVSEAPPPVRIEPPPRNDLRSLLRQTQLAGEAGRRDDFNDALARLEQMLATYPAGGERNAANDVARVYDDLARLWTYEFESPSGGFFDGSSDPAKMMAGYPEYGRYIATQAITAGRVTVYPTRETREFLLQQAAKRIGRMGGMEPAVPPTRTATTVAPTPTPVPAPQQVVMPPTPAPTPAAAATTKPAKTHPAQVTGSQKPSQKPSQTQTSRPSGTHAHPRKPPAHVAAAKPPRSTQRPAITATPVPAPPTPTPVPSPKPVVVKPPPPATTSIARKPAPAPATTTARTPPPTTAASTTPRVTPGPTTTTAPARPATTTSPTAPASGGIAAHPVPAPTPVAPKPIPTPVPPTTTTASARPVPSATTGTTPAAAPSSTSSAAPPNTATSSTSTTAATATDTMPSGATDTSVTTDTATTDTATTDTSTTIPLPAAPKPAGRSFIIPLILILIGIVVLVLLFKRSS